VRRITAPNGEVSLEREPEALRRVISQRTAQVTTELLRRVVEEKGGTGSQARLDDFMVAGKTGTAQKVDARTHGYSAKRIGSFVGFVPADHPRAVILVLIDEPGTSSYGGVVAAPVFRNIAGATMALMHVQPTVRPVTTPVKHQQPVPAGRGKVVPAVDKTPKPAPEPHVELAAVPPVEGPALEPGTPSFLGLSLREALTRAHADGWTVDVRGTGWVAEQSPAPGTPLAGDRRLALELRPDQPTARP
jgi:cell division protein FtsI (penicillin-binding protein 3)